MLYCACGLEDKLKTKEIYISASFLLDTIIQDSSMRERSDVGYISLHYSKNKRKRK